MSYQTRNGDTPARIAMRHGVSVPNLFRANPHKPLTVVQGRQTWSALGLGEEINIPVGVGYLGANLTIRNGSRGPDVTLWQSIIGVKADGIFGPQTQAATIAWQKAHGLTADGIVGPKTWAAALATAAPPIATLPVTLPALPGMPAITVPGLPVSFPSPVTQAPVPVATAPIAAIAVSALSAIDPCLSQNVSMVCAAQSALGLTVDGKYGPATAAAVKKALGSAPPACGTQPWWGPKGQSRCGGAAASPSPSPVIPLPIQPPPISFPDPFTPPPAVFSPPPAVSLPAPAPVYSPPPAAAVAPAPQPIVVAPVTETKKGLSTGAMVAAGVGVAALVGLVAIAASGKKISTSRTTTIRRAPARRKSKSRRKR